MYGTKADIKTNSDCEGCRSRLPLDAKSSLHVTLKQPHPAGTSKITSPGTPTESKERSAFRWLALSNPPKGQQQEHVSVLSASTHWVEAHLSRASAARRSPLAPAGKASHNLTTATKFGSISYHDKGAPCSGIREKVRVLYLATTFDPP